MLKFAFPVSFILAPLTLAPPQQLPTFKTTGDLRQVRGVEWEEQQTRKAKTQWGKQNHRRNIWGSPQLDRCTQSSEYGVALPELSFLRWGRKALKEAAGTYQNFWEVLDSLNVSLHHHRE